MSCCKDPAAIDPGELTTRVTLQKKTTQSIDTFGADVTAWVDEASIWVGFQPLRGIELMVASQITSALTQKVVMRFRHGVTPKKRLREVSNGTTMYYDINSVIDVGRMRTRLELQVTQSPCEVP